MYATIIWYEISRSKTCSREVMRNCVMIGYMVILPFKKKKKINKSSFPPRPGMQTGDAGNL